MTAQPSISDVRAYWERHPLGTLEAPAEPGSREFFEWHDQVRWAEEGAFARHLYEFDGHAGEAVLDIGCGIGWLVVNFARGGARITGLDLTRAAVDLTRRRLDFAGFDAALRVGDAEALPFGDGTFDYVTSAGVLHHTPDTQKAVSEAVRVLRPGGRGLIVLYHRHLLLSPALWPVTRMAIRRIAPPGRTFAGVETPDDLVRLYDGNDNPVGKAYSRRQARQLFAGLARVERVETHYFPTRFLVSGAPPWLRRLCDRLVGLMVYVQFTKP